MKSTHPVSIMVDHLGWSRGDQQFTRLQRTAAGVSSATALSDGITVSGPGSRVADIFSPPPVEQLPPGLAATVSSVGRVMRLPTLSLWEALVAAIIRQVIRADQAQLMYTRLCQVSSRAVSVAETARDNLCPLPSEILTISRDTYRALGMEFKRPTLTRAAEVYLENCATWSTLPPQDLYIQLQTIPRIGPWTAGVVTADVHHAWEFYPHGDLAVRTWARRADPTTAWSNTDAAFEDHWRAIAGEHIGTLTLFILAWGDGQRRSSRPTSNLDNTNRATDHANEERPSCRVYC